MKYGILNEFGERVQNSVRNSKLPPITSRECGFTVPSLYNGPYFKVSNICMQPLTTGLGLRVAAQ